MSAICRVAVLAVVFAVAGCTRSEEYVDVARTQRKAMDDIRAVLAEIKDEKSMAAAKDELDRRFDAFDAIARKARGLPKPSADVLARLEDEQRPMEKALQNLKEEIDRVRALPGGERFFQQYEGRSILGKSS